MDQTGMPFDGRDYFATSKLYADRSRSRMNRIHISRVFRSKTDGYFKFSIASPVLDKDGSFLGVVSATLPIHRTLGLSDRGLHSTRQEVILVGRMDQAPATVSDLSPLGYEYHVLLHNEFDESDRFRKSPFPFTPNPTRTWPRRNDTLPELLSQSEEAVAPDVNHRDPLASVDPKYKGRWLAGFAQVGNTDLMVIVQQRHEDAIGRPVAFAKTLIWYAWAALALPFVAVVVAPWLRAWAGVAISRTRRKSGADGNVQTDGACSAKGEAKRRQC